MPVPTARLLVRAAAAVAVLVLSARLNPPALAQLPPVPEEMKRVYMLVGDWSGMVTFSHGTDSVKFKATVKGSKCSEGWGVLTTLSSDSKEMGKYRETDIFAWDAESKKYHMYTVSNAGEIHDHSGAWATDLKNTLTMKYEGTREGKILNEEIVFMFKSDREMHFRSVSSVMGSPPDVFEGTLKKK